MRDNISLYNCSCRGLVWLILAGGVEDLCRRNQEEKKVGYLLHTHSLLPSRRGPWYLSFQHLLAKHNGRDIQDRGWFQHGQCAQQLGHQRTL